MRAPTVEELLGDLARKLTSPRRPKTAQIPRRTRWSWSIPVPGLHGRRVRVFLPSAGRIRVVWRENGRSIEMPLGHTDYNLAKKQALEIARKIGKLAVRRRMETIMEKIAVFGISPRMRKSERCRHGHMMTIDNISVGSATSKRPRKIRCRMCDIIRQRKRRRLLGHKSRPLASRGVA